MRKISILDEDNHTFERRNVERAIGGTTSHERIVATQNVVRPGAVREIADRSPHTDSRELAKTKLRGLGRKM